MAKKEKLSYLKSIKDNDEFIDVFVISFLGILGLASINITNNLLKLKLNRYREVLNAIHANEDIDIYYIIQELFDQKKIKFQWALDLISILQQFREPHFSFSMHEEEIKDVIKKIPPHLYRKLSSPVKVIFKAYLEDVISIEKLVIKFLAICQRFKYIDMDFYKFAKKMKSQLSSNGEKK